MTKIVRERPKAEDDKDIVRFQVYMSPKKKNPFKRLGACLPVRSMSRWS